MDIRSNLSASTAIVDNVMQRVFDSPQESCLPLNVSENSSYVGDNYLNFLAWTTRIMINQCSLKYNVVLNLLKLYVKHCSWRPNQINWQALLDRDQLRSTDLDNDGLTKVS